jgi:hypothetical protein
VFNGCKNNNALIISKDTKVKVRKEKTLVAHTNSLAHFKANSIPLMWGRGGEGLKVIIENQTKLMLHPELNTRLPPMLVFVKGVLLKTPPNLKRNHQRHTLIYVCLVDPP